MTRHSIFFTALMALPLLALGCGSEDTNGGTNVNENDNHGWYQDGAVQYDSSTTYQDGAVQYDSGQTYYDSGPVGTGITGDPCTGPNDCGGMTISGVECLTTYDPGGFGFGTMEFPGGYCSSSSCGSAGAPCDDEGGVCVDMGMSMAFLCLKPCDSVADCRESEGYECRDPALYGGTGDTYCAPPGGGFDLGDGGFDLGDGGFDLGDGGFNLGDGGFM